EQIAITVTQPVHEAFHCRFLKAEYPGKCCVTIRLCAPQRFSHSSPNCRNARSPPLRLRAERDAIEPVESANAKGLAASAGLRRSGGQQRSGEHSGWRIVANQRARASGRSQSAACA